MNHQKQTFTGEVKQVLAAAKIEKSCCKKAYAYGSRLFKGSDFTLIDRSVLRCPSCAAHLLCGVFMSSGSVNSPDKGHHLEIKTGSKPAADELVILLAENGFEARVSTRRSSSIVYFKDGDTIFGFLSFIGAQKCAFDFLETMIEKQVRNDCNRKTNFDAANMVKAANAGRRQLEAIRYFYDNGKLDTLSDVLAYTARLKYENPSSNLSELAALHDPPITKSCVNHRLAKIIEYYEKGR
ncbi:MAG: DNA-binding protein WhiA [Eubacteriales bacterium]